MQAQFWHSYVEAISAPVDGPGAADVALIPTDPADARLLLDAHVLQKTLYEVRYELANRPAWVGWPLGADRPDASTNDPRAPAPT